MGFVILLSVKQSADALKKFISWYHIMKIGRQSADDRKTVGQWHIIHDLR